MVSIKRGYSSFSVDNLAKAQGFYSKTLGLNAHHDKDMGLLRLALPGGATVMVYPKDNHEPATFTVLNLVVEDIDDAVDDLTASGVKFEIYDGFGQDEKGIARSGGSNPGPSIAWFKDPADNILAVLDE